MSKFELLHELSEKMNRVSKVWTSNSKVDKTSNKSSIGSDVCKIRSFVESQGLILFDWESDWFSSQETSFFDNAKSILSLAKIISKRSTSKFQTKKIFGDTKIFHMKASIHIIFERCQERRVTR
ncbi:hypothetical protein Bca4012_064629 [Brassica carinata]